jgi:hypothetical protein
MVWTTAQGEHDRREAEHEAPQLRCRVQPADLGEDRGDGEEARRGRRQHEHVSGGAGRVRALGQAGRLLLGEWRDRQSDPCQLGERRHVPADQRGERGRSDRCDRDTCDDADRTGHQQLRPGADLVQAHDRRSACSRAARCTRSAERAGPRRALPPRDRSRYAAGRARGVRRWRRSAAGSSPRTARSGVPATSSRIASPAPGRALNRPAAVARRGRSRCAPSARRPET